MDRAQLLLVGLPLFLFCSDVFNLFLVPPAKPAAHQHHHHHHQPDSQPLIQRQQAPLEFPAQRNCFNRRNKRICALACCVACLLLLYIVGKGSGIGLGNTVTIDFCSSCSYRGNAVNMKNMLESQFPGITVALANYPPPLPKRMLSKVVPIFQFGMIAIIAGGEQIFPRIGFAAPPQWYYSLRANRFGSMASTWLLGNFLQSFLQSSGAFEVYCNGDLVFSKLNMKRFPGEIELKDLIAQRISNSRVVDEGQWA